MIDQAPPPPMLLSDFIRRMRHEMTTLGILVAEERAFFLATAHQESARPGTGERRQVTTLASVYNNPFGIKWRESDREKYGQPKRMRANQFDDSAFVLYRIYKSLGHAIAIERVNKIERPGIYAECKENHGGTYPKAGRNPDWPAWVASIAAIHCNQNPDHVGQVLKLWRGYLVEETAGVRA